MRLGVLVSGRGTNLGAVLAAVAGRRLPAIEPAVVISNRAGVPALDVAAQHAVPALVMRRADFPDAGARDAAMGRALAEASVDLALLAGYDNLLRHTFFAAFAGRVINIHPSLLPRHGGRGMVGEAVHRSVLAAGDPETGATVHEVTAELDAGPILAQARLSVVEGDDAARLAARVLALEHRLVVDCLRAISTEAGDRVRAGHLLG
jgi:phosphoribosylglycinamide formyltransferase-1